MRRVIALIDARGVSAISGAMWYPQAFAGKESEGLCEFS